MIVRNIVLSFVQLGIVLGLLQSTAIAGSKVNTAPGSYTDWGGEVDNVVILQTFRLDSYSDIAVESFDTSKVPLPDPKENTYAAVRSAIGTIKAAFLEGFQKNLRQKPGIKQGRGQGRAIVIRIRVTKLDPGSQAARYFASFGAGAVKIEMTGEIVEASSHKTLVRFTQERRSGAGVFGGGYSDLFDRTARQIGGDVAFLLNAF